MGSQLLCCKEASQDQHAKNFVKPEDKNNLESLSNPINQNQIMEILNVGSEEQEVVQRNNYDEQMIIKLQSLFRGYKVRK